MLVAVFAITCELYVVLCGSRGTGSGSVNGLRVSCVGGVIWCHCLMVVSRFCQLSQ